MAEVENFFDPVDSSYETSTSSSSSSSSSY